MNRRCTVFDEVSITKCYKCQEEMYPILDTAWRKHIDGLKTRKTEFFCSDCKVWTTIKVEDYEDIDLDEVEE